MKGEKQPITENTNSSEKEFRILNESRLYLTGIKEMLDNLINHQGKLELGKIKEIADYLDKLVLESAELSSQIDEDASRLVKFSHQFRNNLQIVWDFFDNFSVYKSDIGHQIKVQTAAVSLLEDINLRIKEIK